MISGIDPGNCLRHVDAVHAAVTIRGEIYRLRPIIEAL
jgi:hypothetical protein